MLPDNTFNLSFILKKDTSYARCKLWFDEDMFRVWICSPHPEELPMWERGMKSVCVGIDIE